MSEIVVKETVNTLEERENQRVRAVAAIAVNMDKTFVEAEKILDEMVEEYKNSTGLQRQFEKAVEAEFNV